MKRIDNVYTVQSNNPSVTIILINSPTYGLREVIIDTVNMEKFKKHHWHISKCRNSIYVQTHVRVNNKERLLRGHNLLIPVQQGFDVDHIDGNGLNNLESNLRQVPHKQNIENTKKRKDNTSGYRGVTWNKKDKRWQAQITHNQKGIYIGQYLTAEEAFMAYEQKAKELFKCYIG